MERADGEGEDEVSVVKAFGLEIPNVVKSTMSKTSPRLIVIITKELNHLHLPG